MEAEDNRLCDSFFGKVIVVPGNDGQVPWAKAVFYSHLDSYTDDVLVHRATLGSAPWNKNEHKYIQKLHRGQ